jgi:hypothetical protein
MPNASEPRLDDIRRIAFVTQRFRDLQGLRTVANTLPALILGTGAYWARSSLSVIILLGAFAIYVALRVTWIQSRIDAYYSCRLGRVEPSVPDLDPTLLFGEFQRLGQFQRRASVGPDLERIFLFCEGLLAATVCRDMHLPVFVQTVLVASMLGFEPLRVLIRDWRYRVHWLLPLGVSVAFALRLAAVDSAREFNQWGALVCLCGGAALAVAGVCDHLLLVTSLEGGARIEDISRIAATSDHEAMNGDTI